MARKLGCRIEVASDICLRRLRTASGCRADDDDDDDDDKHSINSCTC